MSSTHYQAYSRWASDEEIKSSLHKINIKSFNSNFGGVPLYSDGISLYIDHADTHTLVIGASGSKKTRLIAMPSLWLYAHAEESFIVTDPKSELYERSYYLLKKKGYKIFVLNLRNPLKSNGWNPLLIPYTHYQKGEKDQANKQIIDIANTIIREKNTNDPYWNESAINLFLGFTLILFECANSNEINLKSLRTLRTEAFKTINNSNTVPFIRENFLKYVDSISYITSVLSGIVDVCDETKSCILSAFDQAMRIFFSQENLINIFSYSDLDMGKIGKEKTAVFLIMPDENTVYHKLVSLFIKQCYTELIGTAQNQTDKKLPRRVNFLLDEFSSLPVIQDFPAMICAARSRNIRFTLIIQSISQLLEMYQYNTETIKTNCENRIFLHSREKPLLEELVSLGGKRNADEYLVSIGRLQTLNKERGEAYILHKHLYPYIANLPDIDEYDNIFVNGKSIPYPRCKKNTQSVFRFTEFCSCLTPMDISEMF